MDDLGVPLFQETPISDCIVLKDGGCDGKTPVFRGLLPSGDRPTNNLVLTGRGQKDVVTRLRFSDMPSILLLFKAAEATREASKTWLWRKTGDLKIY